MNRSTTYKLSEVKKLITYLAIALLCVACEKSPFYNTYLEYIDISNGLSQENIYFECDMLDSIVEISHVGVPFAYSSYWLHTNHLFKNARYDDIKTIDKIYKEIIEKQNFRIYRYKNGAKNYFSFKKWREKYPRSIAFIKDIDNITHTSYSIYAQEEFFE